LILSPGMLTSAPLAAGSISDTRSSLLKLAAQTGTCPPGETYFRAPGFILGCWSAAGAPVPQIVVTHEPSDEGSESPLLFP